MHYKTTKRTTEEQEKHAKQDVSQNTSYFSESASHEPVSEHQQKTKKKHYEYVADWLPDS